MQASELYQKTLDGYLSCLERFPSLTLLSYCREKHVNNTGMRLWMSRKGISLRSLKPVASCQQSVFAPLSTSEPNPASEFLYGITITFSDGVTVSIKQGNAHSINSFINYYNLKTEEIKSCLP
ncbi:hypothetical protein [Bacteroides sp. 519]|uniref:hypothetical protein n=1 Tax=Bacteroides sp. 519 TaxID=2302937 RepID=UPI0013CF7968|nr:hypothetical protein [Bacteroides sp. 519]NDV58443.1 hypothetical protein [Bacteroides sp. 519]